MRISDWSSDVCSSDLQGKKDCCGTCHAWPSSGRCGKLPASQLARNRGNQPGLLYRRLCLQSHHPNLSRGRSEEHTSELQSLMRISYAVFCLKKKIHINNNIFVCIINDMYTI